MSLKPAAQEAIDDLYQTAKTDDEIHELIKWQEELDGERQAALGGQIVKTSELVLQPDGSVEDKKAVQQAIKNGQDPSGAYGGGGRRS